MSGTHLWAYGACITRGLRRSLRLEAVADPWLSEEIPRASRLRLEFVAQLAHVHPQVVGIVSGVFSPDLLQQLAMGHHLPSVVHERGQECVFGRGEVDLLLCNRHIASRQVDLELPDGKDRRVRL